jgi:hypothetical protein
VDQVSAQKRSKAGNVWEGKKHVASDIGGRDHRKARKAAIGGLSGFFSSIFGGLAETTKRKSPAKKGGPRRRALVASKVGIVYVRTKSGPKKVGRCRRKGRRWIR